MVKTNQGGFYLIMRDSNKAIYNVIINGVGTAICHEPPLYFYLRFHGDTWVFFRHVRFNGPDCTTFDMPYSLHPELMFLAVVIILKGY